MHKTIRVVFSLLLIIPLMISPWLAVPAADAASAQEIDIRVDAALKRFRDDVGGGAAFLAKAEGVLVFPSVIKAGFGIGFCFKLAQMLQMLASAACSRPPNLPVAGKFSTGNG